MLKRITFKLPLVGTLPHVHPMTNLSKIARMQAHFLKTKCFPEPAFWAELKTLPYGDILDIALLLADRLNRDCEAWCESLIEAQLPTDQGSQAETTALLARILTRPTAG